MTNLGLSLGKFYEGVSMISESISYCDEVSEKLLSIVNGKDCEKTYNALQKIVSYSFDEEIEFLNEYVETILELNGEERIKSPKVTNVSHLFYLKEGLRIALKGLEMLKEHETLLLDLEKNLETDTYKPFKNGLGVYIDNFKIFKQAFLEEIETI